MSSRRYRVDQELEIYNFRVVPELQISKEVYFLMIYVISLEFVRVFFVAKTGWHVQPDNRDFG